MNSLNRDREKCTWCLKREANSNWEQNNLSGKWKRLCKPCANKRLNNPFNALLKLRKVDEFIK